MTAQSIRAPLAEAVAGLAPPDRDVLLLITWEQLSYDEVARALNIPVGTVRSRLHRARTKIREALVGTPAAATYEEILPMNDLDLLRECAPDAPLLSITELSIARERVLAVAQGRHAFRPAAAERRWAKRHGPARRIVIGGVTVAAAAAITAGLLVWGETPAGVTVPATLTAREVLEHAAGAALKESAVVPRENQFVYTRDVSPGGVVQLSWLSVDGTRNGLTESPVNGK